MPSAARKGTPIGNFWSKVGSVMSARALQLAGGLNPFDWKQIARPSQLEPGTPGAEIERSDWTYWLWMGGRGVGKTRVGSETTRIWVRKYQHVNLIGATADDARDIMIEGESGILAVCPPEERPTYRPSKRRLEWPNGAKSLIFTADEPERLRGKQHERLWADEVGAWRYAEAWDQAMFGLRLGQDPRAIVTTTPKPVKAILQLVKDPATVISRGTTYENRANLAPQFFAQIIRRYEGTRVGDQELKGMLLEDIAGALWNRDTIGESRVKDPARLTIGFQRIVVGVDPAVKATANSDKTGIVGVALGDNGELYVLDDWSCRLAAAGWGARCVELYDKHNADIIVGEVNNGGDLVEVNIRATTRKHINYKAVWASRGKHIRAEPVANLYDQGRVHHVGEFPELERQMCRMTRHGYLPDDEEDDPSPDRLCALVWAIHELALQDTSDELPPPMVW